MAKGSIFALNHVDSKCFRPVKEESLRPIQVFLFLASVIAVLLSISAVFPQDGIQLSNSLRLDFPTLHDLTATAPDKADISNVLKAAEAPLAQAAETPTPNQTTIDTTSPARLHYPNNDPSVLYPFFAALDSAKTSKRVARILHYGDSQIEEDRISNYLREQFQQQFGGAGVGLTSLFPLAPSMSLTQTYSGTLERFSIYGGDSARATHRKYGMMGSFTRFSPPDATVRLKASSVALEHSRAFTRISLLYGNGTGTAKAELYADGKSLGAKTLKAGRGVQLVDWTMTEPPKQTALRFSGASPDLYGVMLDGAEGVALDNIPMRGSAGTVFTAMDMSLIGETAKLVNAKLIILQFGGNAIPMPNLNNNLDSFEKSFLKQLQTVKQHCPDATLLVIGPSDMSIKQKNKMTTHPQVERVRDALKRCAFAVGAPYWDMYEAMGGKNSMPSWVAAKPPLAGSDYIHFTRAGAEKIAALFWNSLINDYALYRQRSF